MNAAAKTESDAVKSTGLDLLRQPVPRHLISPLPKGTKAQNECPNDQKIRCKECGGWHHPNVVHLDYVGHAAATHLLLDADPMWFWEPMAYTDKGLPAFDETGGLWIKLTVCGVTRIGYGHADKKNHMDAGSREKEVIGDALRNAAMRFGLALELWSKANLHDKTEEERNAWFWTCIDGIKTAATMGELRARVAAAIEQARARGDQQAEDDFLIAQADKAATAKPKTPAPTPSRTERPAAATKAPADIHDDDFPF